jgi:hypothetical protein
MNGAPIIARVILYCAAALITLGGLYDIFVPKLPSNLTAMCDGNERASKLARELLRALGGSLVAVGATMALVVSRMGMHHRSRPLWIVLLLVLPSEGLNSFGMYRVGAPYLVPLAFILLTITGVVMAWPGLIS